MGAISRRSFLAGSAAVTALAALPWQGRRAAAAAPASAAAPPGAGDAAVEYALRQGADHWGEQLLTRPDGPSFGNVKPLLGPANVASRYVTESGWYYLPLTDEVYDPARWLEQRDFAIHVADGSQVTSQWCWADFPAQRQYTTFQVGSAHEVFGSAVERLDEPRLWGGFLPILDNAYVDADGTRWERESFVARVDATPALVSFVRFTAHRGRRGPARTTLRLYLHVDDVAGLSSDGTRLTRGGDSYLVSSARGGWAQPNFDIDLDLSTGHAVVQLAVLNTPAPAGSLRADAATYQRTKESVAAYWTRTVAGGATVRVPEPYAMDAMRNLVLQNLVMGWQQSIANGYETTDPHFAFVPEVATSVAALGEMGFLDEYRANIAQIQAKGQGQDAFPSWEQGIKLQSAANYYLLSNDGSYLRDNLPTFQAYLDDFRQQRAKDPNGLLEKQRYGSDIPEPVYGVHLQADAWRGMRDMGLVLRLIGEDDAARSFLGEAAAFRTALTRAIDASSERLPDGSLYLPISLLDPAAPKAYDLVPATRDGSYWNLVIHYALATGILPPGSDAAKGMLSYLYRHGSMFLGLVRFNACSIDPPGVCESDAAANFPPGAAGYDAPGVDGQYGYSLLKFLGDNGEYDRLVLSFYGKLAQDLTPYTFIGGEGATIAPCPDLPPGIRSQWFPPLSANNAVYLRALRELLVHEDRDDDGMPDVLHITPATPRGWLADGKRIEVRDLPTLFGPVTFTLTSHLADGRLTAVVRPPAYEQGRARLGRLLLHVRPPAGTRLHAATVDGRPGSLSGEVVDLGTPGGEVTVVLTCSPVGVPRVDRAVPTAVTPDRLVYRPGDTIPLRVSVEAIGDATVPVTVSVGTPSGWRTPEPVPVTVPSGGQIGRRTVD
ncbi:MAG TPA: twin-arginine translocation signal domain-containing protein, partial [Streptosporangiales bacterium]